MFVNYLKITFRNILKSKSYSFINILGLGIGIACCLLILLFVQDEFSYDRFHDNSDRIFRVAYQGRFGEDVRSTARTPVPLAPALLEELPEVEKAVRIRRVQRSLVKYKNERFFEDAFYWADRAIFDVFSFPLKHGDPQTALSSPFSAVISQSVSERYFGSEDPMGKVFQVTEMGDFQVTGVFEEIPDNSHLSFDILISYDTMESIENLAESEWDVFMISTYILLQPNSNQESLQSKLSDLAARHVPQADPETDFFYVDKLVDLHLHSHLDGELGIPGNVTFIYILITIAFFVLAIACINFMNLSTARSMSRTREVGVRKLLGSNRIRLTIQFLAEAVVLSFLAVALAVAIIEAFLPIFNGLTEKNLDLRYSENPMWLAGLILITLVVALLSGSYPALVLSGLKPVIAVKGRYQALPTGSRLRKVLVVVQFTISIILITSTIVVSSQLDFFRTKELGFEKEQRLILRVQDNQLRSRADILRSGLLEHPNVISASASQYVPGSGLGVYYYEAEGVEQPLNVASYFCDHDFIETMGMELIAGRDFSRTQETDEQNAFIVNETAVKSFGWQKPESALGKQINWDGEKTGRVIGVVKDFHFQPLHEKIAPLIIQIHPEYLRYVVLRIRSDNLPATLEFVRDKYQEFDPKYPLDYVFLDQRFDELYRQEAKLNRIFSYSSAITIIIACMGLIGLAAYSAEQRTKEIGIRKVLGATTVKVFKLLSGEFLVLVMMANLVAWPIAWFVMDGWLNEFAYRIGLQSWMFFAAGAAVVFISLLAVSAQAFKAALANPVDSLRYE